VVVLHAVAVGNKGVSESVCEATLTRVDEVDGELGTAGVSVDVLIEFAAKDKTALPRTFLVSRAWVTLVDTLAQWISDHSSVISFAATVGTARELQRYHQLVVVQRRGRASSRGTSRAASTDRATSIARTSTGWVGRTVHVEGQAAIQSVASSASEGTGPQRFEAVGVTIHVLDYVSIFGEKGLVNTVLGTAGITGPQTLFQWKMHGTDIVSATLGTRVAVHSNGQLSSVVHRGAVEAI